MIWLKLKLHNKNIGNHYLSRPNFLQILKGLHFIKSNPNAYNYN